MYFLKLIKKKDIKCLKQKIFYFYFLFLTFEEKNKIKKIKIMKYFFKIFS